MSNTNGLFSNESARRMLGNMLIHFHAESQMEEIDIKLCETKHAAQLLRKGWKPEHRRVLSLLPGFLKLTY